MLLHCDAVQFKSSFNSVTLRISSPHTHLVDSEPARQLMQPVGMSSGLDGVSRRVAPLHNSGPPGDQRALFISARLESGGSCTQEGQRLKLTPTESHAAAARPATTSCCLPPSPTACHHQRTGLGLPQYAVAGEAVAGPPLGVALPRGVRVEGNLCWVAPSKPAPWQWAAVSRGEVGNLIGFRAVLSSSHKQKNMGSAALPHSIPSAHMLHLGLAWQRSQHFWAAGAGRQQELTPGVRAGREMVGGRAGHFTHTR